jgi:hypothetical protein
MKSLVEDEKEQEAQIDDLDQRVVQKGESFWSFLRAVVGGLFGIFSSARKSKTLRNFSHEVWKPDKKQAMSLSEWEKRHRRK